MNGIISVLGFCETQTSFRSGIWENAEEHGSFLFWDLGKSIRTWVIFVLGSGKKQKNMGHFCSGDLGKSRRTWVIFVLGSGKTQMNMGHFRSGLYRPQKSRG